MSGMGRREFMGLLGGVAAARPLAARGQQPAMPVIGFLHVASAAPFVHLLAAFRQGMKETGYAEGQNLSIVYRWAEGRPERLIGLAEELVRRQVAVIVTGSGERGAFAAKAATRTIPIVFNTGSDPVQSGLVASLGRPGGNLTGVNLLTSELATKRLGLLHDLVPTASIIALLVNPNEPGSTANAREVEAVARLLGRPIHLLIATSESEIDAAFANMMQMRVGALLVGVDSFFNSRRGQITALAARHAVPAIYEQREFAVAGGLMSYGTNLADGYRQQGIYTGRILKGERPADLPVVQMTKFELVINLSTAKALNLTIPPGVLAIADEVIE